MTGSSVSDSGVAGVAGDGDLEHAVVDEEDIVDGEGERRGKALQRQPTPLSRRFT